MEDNMNMRDEIDIKDIDVKSDEEILENIDKEAASFILRKVGEAVITEYNMIQDRLGSTREGAAKIDEQLDAMEGEVSAINKDIEIQAGIIKSLEARMKNETEEAAIKSLMAIRDDAVNCIQELKGKLEGYADKVKDIQDTMCKVKENEVYLTIAGEVLINFGIKYGLVAEKKDE